MEKYPIKRYILSSDTNNCSLHKKDWNRKKFIGQGNYGKVWELCCDNDCDFVMKIQKEPKNIDKEIAIQNKAASAGLALPIIDSWKTRDGKYVIIMEKLDGSVVDLLYKLEINDKEKVAIKLIKMLIKLHCIHIIHGDINGGNIMYKKLKDNKKFDIRDYKFYFIDFGLSKYYSNKVDNENIYDFVGLYEHFFFQIRTDRIKNIISSLIDEMRKIRDDHMINTIWKDEENMIFYKIINRNGNKYEMAKMLPKVDCERKYEYGNDIEECKYTIDENTRISNEIFIGERIKDDLLFDDKFMLDDKRLFNVQYKSFYVKRLAR